MSVQYKTFFWDIFISGKPKKFSLVKTRKRTHVVRAGTKFTLTVNLHAKTLERRLFTGSASCH
jgi:hypothetical protein